MVCRLCGAEAGEFKAGGLTYAECSACSYIELDGAIAPSPEAEERRYRLHQNSYGDARYRGWILDYLDAVAEFLPPGSRVLDYGSGPEPVPARLLTERGCDVTIYDPFFAPGDAWKTRTWDAILVHEVAEHLSAPFAAFRELSALLEPEGALCIRTRFPPADRPAFERWRYRMDETHVGFFGRRSLSWLAESLGLRMALIQAPDRAVLVKTP